MVLSQFLRSNQLKNLLLLRGLFSHGILAFALETKRFSVNYGLDLKQALMSVPFTAKDTPSLSSEWGHPEVAIMLTILSYYYSGLTPAQLEECFVILARIEDPEFEYDKWQESTSLSESLQTFRGVNLEDKAAFEKHLYPKLRRNKAVCDFFMARVVFPKEAKQFAHKLSTSAWDLPLDHQVSTGFSGTNDNHFLLPDSIQQRNIASLEHTSAAVLIDLLKPENRRYIKADNNGHRLSTRDLLEQLVYKKPNGNGIRVLIDVGAQALDMSNRDLMRQWLQLEKTTQAGVFLENGEMMVLERNTWLVEPLLSSPYASKLDHCLVYIDDSHCRGLDIALPETFCAAVTLGPDLHKDMFVQGESSSEVAMTCD